MGDNDGIVTLRDMYNVVLATSADVQRVVILVAGQTAKVDDHETRIRLIESERQDYVTEEDLRQRSVRALTLAGILAGVVSTAVAVADFLLVHH
ncbi:hypothetical protein [Kitasatospora mediocidica]|uniref:hypothetical protein n=1 Tax=Kitasatospora mediocidica TaxID=58352 RepID=UPI00056D6B9A|nr:hypothetical protein [Kitasatospora mediocidica]